MSMEFKVHDLEFPQGIAGLKAPIDEWPITYLLHNEKDIYIGETTSAKKRLKQHKDDPDKQKYNLNVCKIIYSDHFNKSAIYLIETKLIRLIFADNQLHVLNHKTNQIAHNFYDKQEYEDLLPKIWSSLQEQGIAKHDYDEVINSELFKYSPFTSFSDNQTDIIRSIFQIIFNSQKNIELNAIEDVDTDNKAPISDEDISVDEFDNRQKFFAVNGRPGTGKSLVLVKMIYELVTRFGIEPEKICIVHNIASSKNLLKKVLKGMRIRKIDYHSTQTLFNSKKNYDYIFVDEGQSICDNKGKFLRNDFKNQLKELGIDGVDVVLEKGKNIVFMYDPRQSTRDKDIDIVSKLHQIASSSDSLLYKDYTLDTVFRSNESWDQFVRLVLNNDMAAEGVKMDGEYDVKMFDSIKEMHDEIRAKNNEFGMSRMVSGFTRSWDSKKDKTVYEFRDHKYNEYKAQWNREIKGNESWVDIPETIDEIGCVHYIAGVDLNYCGVIIGKDLYYDEKESLIKCSKENYFDKNSIPTIDPKLGVVDQKELYKKIISSYYILLTRGIKGTYLFIEDESLRKHVTKLLNKFMNNINN